MGRHLDWGWRSQDGPTHTAGLLVMTISWGALVLFPVSFLLLQVFLLPMALVYEDTGHHYLARGQKMKMPCLFTTSLRGPTISLLPHSFGQCKSQGQLRLREED